MSIDTQELRRELRRLHAEATTGEHMQAEGAILELLAALPALLDELDAQAATIVERDAEICRLRRELKQAEFARDNHRTEIDRLGVEKGKLRNALSEVSDSNQMWFRKWEAVNADNARLTAELAAMTERAKAAVADLLTLLGVAGMSCCDVCKHNTEKCGECAPAWRGPQPTPDADKIIVGRIDADALPRPMTKEEYLGQFAPAAADRLMAAQHGEQRGRVTVDQDLPFETVNGICDGCASAHTVGCHCPRATWRGPQAQAGEGEKDGRVCEAP